MTTGTFFFPVVIVITDTVVCLAGAQSLLRPEKKVPVVCLAGALSLLQLENKNFQSSVWRVGDRYYDRKKNLATKWRMDIGRDGYWKPHVSNSSALSVPKISKAVAAHKK